MILIAVSSTNIIAVAVNCYHCQPPFVNECPLGLVSDAKLFRVFLADYLSVARFYYTKLDALLWHSIGLAYASLVEHHALCGVCEWQGEFVLFFRKVDCHVAGVRVGERKADVSQVVAVDRFLPRIHRISAEP